MVKKISPGIHISVVCTFQPLMSNLHKPEYIFSYQISILNSSKVPVRLLKRRWEIFDSLNSIKTVEGIGVVGKQPVIEPLGTFTYTSAVAINSEIGKMKGSYTLIDLSTHHEMEVNIPEFQLILPSKFN